MKRQNARSADATPPTVNSEWVGCLLRFRGLRAADIALRVGVDESVVRKAINNLGPIDPQTKHRIVVSIARAVRRPMARLLVGKVAA